MHDFLDWEERGSFVRIKAEFIKYSVVELVYLQA